MKLLHATLLATFGLTASCQTAREAVPASEELSAPDEEAPVATEEAPPSPIALAEIDALIASQGIDTTASGWKTNLDLPPVATFDGATTYYWVLETNVGTIRLRLFHDVAPMHVTSTMYLTRLGFYDGIAFHRVIPGFMAQGGDPLGNGRGGPGYAYDGEFAPDVSHDRPGLLSMANAGPGTDGSQFFITFVPYPALDGDHSIFGEVVEGMDAVEALEQRGSRRGTPKEPLTIVRATIETEPAQ